MHLFYLFFVFLLSSFFFFRFLSFNVSESPARVYVVALACRIQCANGMAYCLIHSLRAHYNVVLQYSINSSTVTIRWYLSVVTTEPVLVYFEVSIFSLGWRISTVQWCPRYSLLTNGYPHFFRSATRTLGRACPFLQARVQYPNILCIYSNNIRTELFAGGIKKTDMHAAHRKRGGENMEETAWILRWAMMRGRLPHHNIG